MHHRIIHLLITVFHKMDHIIKFLKTATAAVITLEKSMFKVKFTEIGKIIMEAKIN